MNTNTHFNVIIIGGSYSGLAAAMALGRALRTVLVIDSGKPCNRQTPQSHNFITQDGKAPSEISALAKQQVQKYETVNFFSGTAVSGTKTSKGFEIKVSSGETFSAQRIIFASGVKDSMLPIDGFAECWGISVLHCPYCHGYEVRNKKTGILLNGEPAYDLARLLSNWTKDLTLYTNGKSTLSDEQTKKLKTRNINVVEKEVTKLEHSNGYVNHLHFKDGTSEPLEAIYAHCPFEQNCSIPAALNCEFTEDGFVKVDAMQKTNIEGIFASGDCTNRMRTVANAVAQGTTAGMALNREWVLEEF
jgi:thioredoxin reductase